MTRRQKLTSWARLFAEYAGAQGAVQLLAIVAGLWLVHLLPVRDYALYTLALSLLTFLGVFSDLGISGALAYFRRETRIRQEPFEPYVLAALRLRRILLLAGAVAGGAFVAWAGTSRGFGPAELCLIGAILFASVWLQIDAAVRLLLMRFEGEFRASYRAEVAGNACRALGVAAMWAASSTSAAAALATNALSSFVVRALTATSAKRPGDDAGHARAHAASLVRFVLPTALSAAYFSIQGPLTVWLAAYFGATRSIAEVGALGRLGVIFSVVSGFIGTVLIPRLAVVTDDRHYLRRVLQCWAVLLAFGGSVVAAAMLFPTAFLFLIGGTYAGLERGVELVAAAAVLANIGGFLVAINMARGWVASQPLVLLVFAAVQVALIAHLDLSTTIGILYFGLYSNLTGMALQMAISARGFLGANASRKASS